MNVKVLIVDNVRGPMVGKRWKVQAGVMCEAQPGEEDFVVLGTPNQANEFAQRPEEWLATWHEGCQPHGFRGRRFSHDGSDPVWSQGLQTLIEATENRESNVGNAFKRLIFCLKDPESAFVAEATKVLNALYRDTIGGDICQVIGDEMPSDNRRLCEILDSVADSSVMKNAIMEKCEEYKASLDEQNALQKLGDFRDFLLGSDDGVDGIVQKIRVLAPTN